MISTAPASRKVIQLAIIIGHEPSNKPYISHIVTPLVKMAYMPREISWVWRVRHTFHAWGMKAVVVSMAAILPIQSRVSIVQQIPRLSYDRDEGYVHGWFKVPNTIRFMNCAWLCFGVCKFWCEHNSIFIDATDFSTTNLYIAPSEDKQVMLNTLKYSTIENVCMNQQPLAIL